MNDQLRTQPTEGYASHFDPTRGPGGQLLGESQIGTLGEHVLEVGTSTELELHPEIDSFCFVRSGQVRVVTGDGVVLGDLATHDSISIPAGIAYRIEAVGSAGDTADVIHFYVSKEQLPTSFQPFST